MRQNKTKRDKLVTKTNIKNALPLGPKTGIADPIWSPMVECISGWFLESTDLDMHTESGHEEMTC